MYVITDLTTLLFPWFTIGCFIPFFNIYIQLNERIDLEWLH